MLSDDDDLNRTSLVANAAGLCAGGPSIPDVLAVNGARMGIAVLLLLPDWADNTAVGCWDEYRAGALSDTSAALV